MRFKILGRHVLGSDLSSFRTRYLGGGYLQEMESLRVDFHMESPHF